MYARACVCGGLVCVGGGGGVRACVFLPILFRSNEANRSLKVACVSWVCCSYKNCGLSTSQFLRHLN